MSRCCKKEGRKEGGEGGKEGGKGEGGGRERERKEGRKKNLYIDCLHFKHYFIHKSYLKIPTSSSFSLKILEGEKKKP